MADIHPLHLITRSEEFRSKGNSQPFPIFLFRSSILRILFGFYILLEMDAYIYDQFATKTLNLQFRYFMIPFPYSCQAEIRGMRLGL